MKIEQSMAIFIQVHRVLDTTFDMGGDYIVCDVGGTTMVGSDAPEGILKFWPTRLAKTALSSWKKMTLYFL